MQGASELVEHFFRHSYGRLVSAMTSALGLQRLDLAENVVQEALLEALESWKLGQIPDRPTAWLFRVAKNRAIDILRREQTATRLEATFTQIEASLAADRYNEPETYLGSEIADSQLRMMFACCDPDLAPASRVALILKILCGLSTAEIAQALLVKEEAMQKRIVRAKSFLARRGELAIPAGSALAPRAGSVHQALYLLFNEGYNSQHPSDLMRRDLCDEAMRLTALLAEHPDCGRPGTWALLALEHFHVARFDARLDSEGRILLLADQDRSIWNQTLIARGFSCLEKSARGDHLSAYHLQAAIAGHHCLAQSFEQTNWSAIVELYDQLLAIERSPVWELNRAVAVGEAEGGVAGEAALAAIHDRRALDSYYLYHAVCGEFAFRRGDSVEAAASFRRALGLTRSAAERALLGRKIEGCQAEDVRQ